MGVTFCALFRVSLLAACLASAAAWPATAGDAAAEGGTELERQTFLLINQYREQQDLPALKWNDGIGSLARAHSRDMANGDADFGHGGFGNRVDGMKALVAGFRGAGENVLYMSSGTDAPARAVDIWLHSPHHLKNIRGDYTQSGIGVWKSPDGTLYFTELFLKTVEPGTP